MNHQFTLPNFPDSTFKMKYSTWFGIQTLHKDDLPIKRSNEKGKPFLIPTDTGEMVKAYPKSGFPDIVRSLEINNIRYNIVEKLKWYDFAIALLPFCWAFIGNSFSIGIAFAAFITNIELLRNNTEGITKYLKVICFTLAAYSLHALMS